MFSTLQSTKPHSTTTQGEMSSGEIGVKLQAMVFNVVREESECVHT